MYCLACVLHLFLYTCVCLVVGTCVSACVHHSVGSIYYKKIIYMYHVFLDILGDLEIDIKC